MIGVAGLEAGTESLNLLRSRPRGAQHLKTAVQNASSCAELVCRLLPHFLSPDVKMNL